MTSTRLHGVHAGWTAEIDLESLVVVVLDKRADLAREIGTGEKEARCPECRSIIYSRRHRLCGVCSHPLPDDLLFSRRDAQRVERLLQTERNRHRKWLEHRAETLL